jgi:hypothetical protein
MFLVPCQFTIGLALTRFGWGINMMFVVGRSEEVEHRPIQKEAIKMGGPASKDVMVMRIMCKAAVSKVHGPTNFMIRK